MGEEGEGGTNGKAVMTSVVIGCCAGCLVGNRSKETSVPRGGSTASDRLLEGLRGRRQRAPSS